MITTRKKQSFGIAAVELGAPVSAVPSIPVNLNEWEHAVLMDTFYSAGGRETVSSTNLRMMWDQKNLYLYLICYEKEAAEILESETTQYFVQTQRNRREPGRKRE